MKITNLPSYFALLTLVSIAAPTATSEAAVAMTTVQTNVALNKTTYGDVAYSAPTSNGVDGNTGNFTHADYPTSATPYPGEATNAPNPYWEVDLGGSFALDSFTVYDRSQGGCCDPNRLDGSIVSLLGSGGSVVSTQTLSVTTTAVGEALIFTNGGSGYAGVERVRIDGVSGGNPIRYFQFAEFEAVATIQQPVNWAAGATGQFYNAGGTPVATYSGQGVGNITDGNPGTVSHPNDSASAGYYVDIDLGQEILIDSIDLTGRVGCCDPNRLTDPVIEIFDANNNLTNTINGSGPFSGSNVLAAGDVAGQYIRITNGNGADYGPEIAELLVYGVIPEPSSTLLALSGALLLLGRRRPR